MDWNTILFAARWVIIALFYSILVILLVGVYREASLRFGKQTAEDSIVYGRLRVIQPGSDPHTPPGTIYNLRTTTRLGAGQDNDIILGDRFVSGRHFQLRWDGVAWWLEDLNSKNGTFVNRQQCTPGIPQFLPQGAMISAGDMILELIE